MHDWCRLMMYSAVTYYCQASEKKKKEEEEKEKRATHASVCLLAHSHLQCECNVLLCPKQATFFLLQLTNLESKTHQSHANWMS